MLELLRNNITSHEYLRMGWYAVRNRSANEVEEDNDFSARDEKEKSLFSSGIWTEPTFSISPKDLGIENLKEALAKAIARKVKEEFPSLCEEMSGKRDKYERQRASLGDARNNEHDQRQYLHGIMSRYVAELDRSLSGRYHKNIPRNHPSKLALHIEDLHKYFNKEMRDRGPTYAFSPPNGERKPLVSINGLPFGNEQHDILQWIRQECDSARGPEPQGDLPPDMKQKLFLQQIESWRSIANDYLEKVEAVSAKCAEYLFTTTCRDDTLRMKLRLRLNADYKASVKRAHEELEAIIKDHEYLRTWSPMMDARIKDLKKQREKPINIFYPNGTPGIPQNNGNLHNKNQTTTAPLTSPSPQGIFSQPVTPPPPGQPTFGQPAFGQPASPAFGRSASSACAPQQTMFPESTYHHPREATEAELSTPQVSEEDLIKLHDWVWAYYDVALPRFVDNVAIQVVQRHLMGDSGPLKVFNSRWVFKLPPKDLDRLAGEDEDIKLERERLRRKIDGLEEAIKVAEDAQE